MAGCGMVQEVSRIYVESVSYAGAAEEAEFAYKDIDNVFEASSLSGTSLPVAKLISLGNVKG